ncbi:aminopeptidase [Tuberibacillus sp. Marseille-P3662]|uniref:aminopeptidase n=1 Tax=Tuberibacillus sp. Marseille-P3662 TaxID=1965358 RepID=UPI000A1C8325|nr:aminopeptidase [Tuberibacillus sp. Marseille-P3662]
MDHFQSKLEKYAELVVKIGLNVQKDQPVIIQAPIEAAEFAREAVRAAYRNGAKKVDVDYSDAPTGRIQFEEQPEESLKDVPQWKVDRFQAFVEDNGALLNITGQDPNALSGVDTNRIMIAQQASGKALKFFKEAQLKGDIHWCIAGVPTESWATQVFPDKTPEEAVAALWEAIFKTVRLDEDDPVAAWEAHSENLKDKMNYLNEQNFKALHYKAPGTDLTIELNPDHLWVGAGHESPNGLTYIPNMPTEEVFSAPRKYGVNGTVTSTKPLALNGNLIENFSFTFENGKVVDFSAEKGYDALKSMLDTDEGARYLGEVALVPDQSPISQSGIIFYNTLYDENASCHIALGNAITMNIEGGDQMDSDALEQHEVTESVVHTDFMIGSSELDIDAETQDGDIKPLFRNGNWAI